MIQLMCRRVAIAAADDADRRGSFDIRLIDATWSKWVSSTGAKESILTLDFEDKVNEITNPLHHPIQTVQCEGNACDDLRFYMPKKFGSMSKSVELKGKLTIWTEKFKEAEMKCPPGHFVANLRCSGSFCEQKEMLCAEPTGDSWMVTGKPYYSHCFTNKLKLPWMTWYRDFKSWIRGRGRTCVGTPEKNMPDKQSCGSDGIVVGIRCYGAECDRMQLICGTVDANIELASGNILSASTMQKTMVAQGLLDTSATWVEKPDGDAPVVDSVWDGGKQKNVNPMKTLALGIASSAVALRLPFVVFSVGVLTVLAGALP